MLHSGKTKTRKHQMPEIKHRSNTWCPKCDRTPRNEPGWNKTTTNRDKRRRTRCWRSSGRQRQKPLVLLLGLAAVTTLRVGLSLSLSSDQQQQLVTGSSNDDQMTAQMRNLSRIDNQNDNPAQPAALLNSTTDDDASQNQLPSDEHTNEFKIILTIVYLVIFVIGVCGNVCNCLVIADSRNRYMKTATNYYLFSLSISDLLLLTFGLPHDIVNLWHPSPYLFGSFVCISRGWISEASTYASVLVIVAFTVERYLAICHPLKAHTLSRLSRSIKIIMIIWLVASSCALVVVWQFGIQEIIVDAEPDNSAGTGLEATSGSGSNLNVAIPQLVNSNSSSSSSLVATIESTTIGTGQRASRAIAQCTTVALNTRVFELSVIIFFIIPMTLITILYIKLGHRLSQKTTVIKRNRLNRERQMSQRQAANAFRGELCSSTGAVSLSCSHSHSSSGGGQTIALTLNSRADQEQKNACWPSNLALNKQHHQPPKKPPRHLMKQHEVHVTLTSPESERLVNDGQNQVAKLDNANMAIAQVECHETGKLCLCCLTDTITTTTAGGGGGGKPTMTTTIPQRANSNSAVNELNCCKRSRTNKQSNGDEERSLSVEAIQTNKNNIGKTGEIGNHDSQRCWRERIDNEQRLEPSADYHHRPKDGLRGSASSGSGASVSEGGNTCERRKRDGKLRHGQQDLFCGASGAQQSEKKRMIDNGNTNEERPTPPYKRPNGGGNSLRPAGLRRQAGDNAEASSWIRMDHFGAGDRATHALASEKCELDARPSIELRQIAIGDGGEDDDDDEANANVGSGICMQQTILLGEDDYAGEPLRGQTLAKEKEENVQENGRPSTAPMEIAASRGQLDNSAPALASRSLNNGLLQPTPFGEPLDGHHYPDKERLPDQEKQQQQQQQSRRPSKEATTMTMENSDTPLAGCARKKATAKQRQASSSELFALNSTVNTSSMKSVIKMLVSVVVMFFICWAPFHAQRLMAIYVREPTNEQVFVYNLLNHISGISYYISAVANPILYSLFSMRFRQAFRDTFSSMNLCPAFVLANPAAK